MSLTRNIQQSELVWEENLFGIKPAWTIEPLVTIIKKLARQSLECDCNIEFLAQGAFNKVYSVKCSDGDYVFRVALPVAPKIKTLSEVETINSSAPRQAFPFLKSLHTMQISTMSWVLSGSSWSVYMVFLCANAGAQCPG